MENLSIKSVTVDNFKGAKHIKITDMSKVTYICGPNGSGKTSLIDGICYALEKKAVSKRVINPVRTGETKAIVELDLGDIKVKRMWYGNKTILEVFDANGRQLQSPQGVLDAYIGHLALDPQAFSAMKDREQREEFLKIADLGGVDLGEMAIERKDLYNERTISNRTIKDLKGHLTEMASYPQDTPDEEISITDLTEKFTAASKKIDEHSQNKALTLNIERDLLEKQETIELLKDQIKDLMSRHDELSVSVEEYVDPNLPGIQTELKEADTMNQNVRQKKEHAAKEKTVKEEQEVSDEYTAAIEYLDRTKAEALEKANIPVPGLGIDDECVTYNGHPLSQCAASEQWDVCVRMAAAMEPKLRTIFIREGSLLDDDYTAAIEKFADEEGYQLLIEKVSTDCKNGFIIRDGELVDGPHTKP